MIDRTVHTRQGDVIGEDLGAVHRWLGIRYAVAERFGLPQPPEPWTGVRSVQAKPAQCPQNLPGPARMAKIDPPGFSEDCLALNIWAPSDAGDEPKPVFFWIHGGAFVGGSGNDFDGAELAELGDMVVVTINYRLSVLGFVNFGAVLDLPDQPSNLGLRDQIAALEWVRDNIAAFGGDPDRVTIAGESAGSMSVSLLMLCERAWPLFSGAIMQSGAISLIHDNPMSVQVAERYLHHLALGPDDGLEKLRSLSLRELFDAQAAVLKDLHLTIPAAPWFDGDLLPGSLEAARTARRAPVPLLAGANREEIRLFEVMPGPGILPTKWEDLERVLSSQLTNAQAERVLAAYPRTKQGRRALATDLTFAMPTRNFAERHAGDQPTWSYRFDYRHPLVGAAHGLEQAFIWSFSGKLATLARGGPLTGKRKVLADTMKRHWTEFVNHGRPGPEWPAFTPEHRSTMIFGLESTVEDDPDGDRRTAWAGRDVGPGITPGEGAGTVR